MEYAAAIVKPNKNLYIVSVCALFAISVTNLDHFKYAQARSYLGINKNMQSILYLSHSVPFSEWKNVV